MKPRFVSSHGLYPGAPYEYAAIAPPEAELVFAAGACPIDESGKVTAPADYEGQARAAVENLRTALAGAGSTFDAVLKTTVYVVARAQPDLVRVWDVVAESFSPSRPPSTLLGVAFLGYPDQLVEIDAVALAG